MPKPSRTTIASVAQQVVGQAERVDHVDERHGREGEREREPGDHPERPPPPAGDPGRERHRQHRQHAGRKRRRGTGHEREAIRATTPRTLAGADYESLTGAAEICPTQVWSNSDALRLLSASAC